jgi:uncharacterized membrane protein
VLESRLGPQYLPLRPLYGVGAVACTLLLHSSIKEPILIFLWCMLICSVVEYFASFVMEKAFGTVTWDYSDKLLNLHGRICWSTPATGACSRCSFCTCSTVSSTVRSPI